MSAAFDQVSFLLFCLESTGGKIDYSFVAKEYERIHGVGFTGAALHKRFIRLKAKADEGKQPAEVAAGGAEKKGNAKKGNEKKRGSTKSDAAAKKRVKQEEKSESD
jgi:hypothetical protein